jgi:TorA maturation chaperone TorD
VSHLPDLLEALADVFLSPGAFPVAAFEAALGADWPPPALKTALATLLAAPREGLDVAYTESFLVGRQRPPTHLDESALQTGRVADPAILADLDDIYGAIGLRPDTDFRILPDHVGLQLRALAHLLRHLASRADPASDPALGQARRLLRDHLGPLVRRLDAALAEAHPCYAAAAHLQGGTLAFVDELLA